MLGREPGIHAPTIAGPQTSMCIWYQIPLLQTHTCTHVSTIKGPFWCFHAFMFWWLFFWEGGRERGSNLLATSTQTWATKKKKIDMLPPYLHTDTQTNTDTHTCTQTASQLPVVLCSLLICWVSPSPLRLLASPLLDIREKDSAEGENMKKRYSLGSIHRAS